MLCTVVVMWNTTLQTGSNGIRLVENRYLRELIMGQVNQNNTYELELQQYKHYSKNI